MFGVQPTTAITNSSTNARALCHGIRTDETTNGSRPVDHQNADVGIIKHTYRIPSEGDEGQWRPIFARSVTDSAENIRRAGSHVSKTNVSLQPIQNNDSLISKFEYAIDRRKLVGQLDRRPVRRDEPRFLRVYSDRLQDLCQNDKRECAHLDILVLETFPGKREYSTRLNP